MSSRVRVAMFDAVGGPTKLQKAPGDRYWAGPTDAGTYRGARCGQHSSPSYPDWSKIRWGSEVREVGGEIQVKHDGKWQPLSKLSPKLTKMDLMLKNLEYWNKFEMPTEWRFNDFGHVTCYFYKDLNGNGRLDTDAGEDIHKEYFHTTPPDEANTAAGRPVKLVESHGCIHLKPNDIDDMIAKGYFQAGNTVLVHKYSEKLPAWKDDAAGTRPFEVHFFPGPQKVVITGRRPARRA
jgi:hypothetical protein